MDPSTNPPNQMDRTYPWNDAELEVFAYIQELIRTKQARMSYDVEPFLRRKFDWVTHNSSYRLAMAYGRYRNKIEALLAERQSSSDPENVKANCCSPCEATS